MTLLEEKQLIKVPALSGIPNISGKPDILDNLKYTPKGPIYLTYPSVDGVPDITW